MDLPVAFNADCEPCAECGATYISWVQDFPGIDWFRCSKCGNDAKGNMNPHIAKENWNKAQHAKRQA